jgi:hypothetical protein
MLFPFASLRGQVHYNQPTSRIVRNADGTVLSVKVDPHQQREEEVLRDASGGVISKLVRELDDEYNPKRAFKYDGANRLISKHEYLCLKGRIEEEEVFDPRDNLIMKLAFFYDTKNRMIRIDQFNSKGVLVSVSKSSGVGVDPVLQVVPSTPPTQKTSR